MTYDPLRLRLEGLIDWPPVIGNQPFMCMVQGLPDRSIEAPTIQGFTPVGLKTPPWSRRAGVGPPAWVRHASEVKQKPAAWMPWNYGENLTRLATAA
jgi:hypothetical protein